MLCKVYNDGSHYIAVPKSKYNSNKKGTLAQKSSMDEDFEKFYLEALDLRLSVKDQKTYVRAKIAEIYGDVEDLLDEFIDTHFANKAKNLYLRKRRFKRKVFLVDQNIYVPYFVTFTYSDELQTPESFEKKIRKCLSNLHSRKGWLYGMVDEMGELGERLHYHAIVFVPRGKMVGELNERSVYSHKKHCMVEICENSFFTKYGQNDFVELKSKNGDFSRKVDYILKYIGKGNGKIIYSRGMPADVVADVEKEIVSAEMEDFCVKFVLFDNFFIRYTRVSKSVYIIGNLFDFCELEE